MSQRNLSTNRFSWEKNSYLHHHGCVPWDTGWCLCEWFQTESDTRPRILQRRPTVGVYIRTRGLMIASRYLHRCNSRWYSQSWCLLRLSAAAPGNGHLQGKKEITTEQGPLSGCCVHHSETITFTALSAASTRLFSDPKGLCVEGSVPACDTTGRRAWWEEGRSLEVWPWRGRWDLDPFSITCFFHDAQSCYRPKATRSTNYGLETFKPCEPK